MKNAYEVVSEVMFLCKCTQKWSPSNGYLLACNNFEWSAPQREQRTPLSPFEWVMHGFLFAFMIVHNVTRQRSILCMYVQKCPLQSVDIIHLNPAIYKITEKLHEKRKMEIPESDIARIHIFFLA